MKITAIRASIIGGAFFLIVGASLFAFAKPIERVNPSYYGEVEEYDQRIKEIMQDTYEHELDSSEVKPPQEPASMTPEVPASCPEGQEPIGDGNCRITPTGCPYGDSVPMEYCYQ